MHLRGVVIAVVLPLMALFIFALSTFHWSNESPHLRKEVTSPPVQTTGRSDLDTIQLPMDSERKKTSTVLPTEDDKQMRSETRHFLMPCEFETRLPGSTIDELTSKYLSRDAHLTRLAWIDAVEQLMSSRAGDSFSVFTPLSLATRMRHSIENEALLMKQLQGRVSRTSTSWVVRWPRSLDSELADASTWCDNTLWTLANLDDQHLDSLSLTPYIFDFLLLPASFLLSSEWGLSTTQPEQRTKGFRRLVALLGMAKVSIIIPDRLMFLDDGGVDATDGLLTQSQLDEIAAVAPPWFGHVTFARKKQPAGFTGSRARPVHFVSTESVTRQAKHEFYCSSQNGAKLYRLNFDASSSWTPTLTAWERVGGSSTPQVSTEHEGRSDRRPLASATTVYPVLSRLDSPEITMAGTGERYTDHGSESNIYLTKLAMVNMRMILGMEPTFDTRLRLWDAASRLPLFRDCIVANVCVIGNATTWCDHNAKPESFRPGYTVRAAVDADGRKCRRKVRKIAEGMKC